MSAFDPSALPTRKWVATQTTAIAALLVSWTTLGTWDASLTIAAIGIVAQAVVGYLVPNEPTPGGVPGRTPVV
jgi:hypothetical protein